MPVLDLDYREDSNAEVDMNVVMTGGDELVEVQATGEGVSFSREQLDRLLDLAASRDRDVAARPGRGRGRPPAQICRPAGGLVSVTMEFVLATRNGHKLKELAAMLAPHRLEPLPR